MYSMRETSDLAMQHVGRECAAPHGAQPSAFKGVYDKLGLDLRRILEKIEDA